MDHEAVKILVLVTAYTGVNPVHRKHTVFFATLVSGELVDPKLNANHNSAKGKHANIHAPRM